MDIWAIIVTAAFAVLSSVLAFVLQGQIKKNRQLRDEQKQKQQMQRDAIQNGMRCILRKHLIDEHELWMSKGYITAKALDSGLAMYRAYKDLGGNGMVDHMDEEIRTLPIRN